LLNSSKRFFGIAFVLIVKLCPNAKNKLKILRGPLKKS